MKKKWTPLWGTASSVMAISSMKKSDVKKMLPPDIALTAQSFTAPDEHPIVFQLNKQKIRILLPIFTINYYEFIPLIPLVHFKDNPSKNYQMSPILYVSSRLIVLGARIVWHLNKVFAKFSFTPKVKTMFDAQDILAKISRKDISDAVSLQVNGEGFVGTMADFPYLVEFEPYLNTDAIINSPSNQYWTAVYRIAPAEVQGAPVHIDLNMPELPKLQEANVPSIAKALMGGFKINFRWTLQWPRKYVPKS